MSVLTTFIPGVPAPQGSKTAVLRGRRAVLIEASKATAPWRATVTAWARHRADAEKALLRLVEEVG